MKFQPLDSLLVLIVAWLLIALPSSGPAQEVDFKNDVQPIFEAKCLHCHGPDEQESALRLDQRASMLLGGDSGLAALVPGKPDKSLLLEVINHVNPDMAMPPDDDKLSDEEIATITKWVQQGAKWPGQMDAVAKRSSNHWAFQPVKRPPVPSTTDRMQSTIDQFLQRKLRENNLQFSKPSPPDQLIRRASIVLTGLAPTPEEVRSFVAEYQVDSEHAYSKLVDRLMASPHFGERWAQHWLDVIRWAETNGSEANLYRKNAWVYRDYVVDAFNSDKPYDQFLKEQIAGDSLGTGEAMGFLVAGPHVPAATVGREPSAIRQARADRMDEIMQTVGTSVLGLSIGCARCHNHKFDPLTIKDYYAMTGVFQDIEFGSRLPEYLDRHPRQTSANEISKQINSNRKQLAEMGSWEEDWGAFREIHFLPVKTDSIRIRFQMKNVTLDEFEVFEPDTGLNLALASGGTQIEGYPELGVEERNPIQRVIDGDYGTMTWRARVAPKDLKDTATQPWIQLTFNQEKFIERIRLSSNREYFYDTDYLEKKPYLPKYQYHIDIRKSDGSWQPWVNAWHIQKQLNKQHQGRAKLLGQLQDAIGKLNEHGPQPSFVGRLISPAKSFVLLRGSPESPRDEVAPAAPEILNGDLDLDSKSSGAQRRLRFAKWITRKAHPLTSRVMVNRIWHHIFGSGIVSTTSDFGKAGAKPIHPELLDFLASEFVSSEDGKVAWSMKSMIRQIVMSRAFRQSSQPSEAGLKADASSTLLWRFPPKRVEAEVIRDSILLASGSLDRSIGGKSYRIHNEKKTYAQWEVIDNHGPHTWRRMIYQERMRRVDDGMFTAFDFPDCGQIRPKRPVSTTPLQALNLMNSKFVIDQSNRIAKLALDQSDRQLKPAVVKIFWKLLGRAPSENELGDCVRLAQSTNLAMVCRALINSNEFAFLP